jgi:hypothetical protein
LAQCVVSSDARLEPTTQSFSRGDQKGPKNGSKARARMMIASRFRTTGGPVAKALCDYTKWPEVKALRIRTAARR